MLAILANRFTAFAADFGHVVTCVDKDAAKIERLKRGQKVDPSEIDQAAMD